jgi:hypothetical protein
MRFILGIVLGVAVTVGAAYVRDSMSDTAANRKALVNWDVAGAIVGKAWTLAGEQLNKLTGK